MYESTNFTIITTDTALILALCFWRNWCTNLCATYKTIAK